VRYDSDAHWERFGRQDPYFGVFSSPAHHRDRLDGTTLDAFFASGEAHVADVLGWVRAETGPDFRPRAVLDHGCGVGRVAIPFAAVAQRVVGVDVSASMLAEARRNCEARGVANVELLDAAALAHLSPEFDLVHSFLVLQHVAPARGLGIVEQLAGLLRPGGAGVIQVPLAAGGHAERAYQWVRRTVPLAYNLGNVARGRPWGHPDMQMHAYPLNALVLRLRRRAISGVRVVMADDPGDRGFASCVLVFARPAAGAGD